MPNLILVRHSLPEIDPGLPAHAWRLSEAGGMRCLTLAHQPFPFWKRLGLPSFVLLSRPGYEVLTVVEVRGRL